ncbi:hypothetical protein FGG08_000307 [Glutinoglossum americanum]|uniref:Uncharacterized protein n=1 Tax=Glutinoglossum americanum TaxID=1670608 RepID=A0A9P8IDR2_9PEZI|nr:hypothetical protein FGG08_000307 [Glutinoglossum americanum]
MARDKSKFGQDWVTKHLPQLKQEWAARKAKQAEEWEAYVADKTERNEAEEKAKQEEHMRKHWVRADGRPWTPAVKATAGQSRSVAGPSTSTGPSKPRARQDPVAHRAPAENGWGERLRGPRSGLAEEYRTESSTTNGEGEGSEYDSDTSFRDSLDLVLGADEWGTASPPPESPNKRKRTDKDENPSESEDDEDLKPAAKEAKSEEAPRWDRDRLVNKSLPRKRPLPVAAGEGKSGVVAGRVAAPARGERGDVVVRKTPHPLSIAQSADYERVEDAGEEAHVRELKIDEPKSDGIPRRVESVGEESQAPNPKAASASPTTCGISPPRATAKRKRGGENVDPGEPGPVNNEIGGTQAPPAKRGRGRPAKNPASLPTEEKTCEIPAANAAAAQLAVAPVQAAKHGRGRSRKNPIHSQAVLRLVEIWAITPPTASDRNNGTAAKRGRGRPRRHPPPPTPTAGKRKRDEGGKNEAAAETQDAERADITASMGGPVRKRVRKLTPKAAEAAEAAVESRRTCQRTVNYPDGTVCKDNADDLVVPSRPRASSPSDGRLGRAAEKE